MAYQNIIEKFKISWEEFAYSSIKNCELKTLEELILSFKEFEKSYIEMYNKEVKSIVDNWDIYLNFFKYEDYKFDSNRNVWVKLITHKVKKHNTMLYESQFDYEDDEFIITKEEGDKMFQEKKQNYLKENLITSLSKEIEYVDYREMIRQQYLAFTYFRISDINFRTSGIVYYDFINELSAYYNTTNNEQRKEFVRKWIKNAGFEIKTSKHFGRKNFSKLRDLILEEEAEELYNKIPKKENG